MEQYFICRLHHAVPESLDLAHDLTSVTSCHKVSMKEFSDDVETLKEGLDLTKELLANMSELEKPASDNEEENFDYDARVAALQKKHDEFSQMHEKSAELLRETNEEFAELCAYFGENPKDTSPDAIFSTVRDFVSRISFCIEQINSKAKRIARRQSTVVSS